jgi:predicted RNA-binding protein associated with RNAse of E/G family
VTIRTPTFGGTTTSFRSPGAATRTLWLLWEEDWAFRCWYVQLWKPIVETATGIETMDHALDIVVDPDGAWRWWDEDDFDEAQKLGVFTPEQATAVRAEGERVIAPHPWPTGWEDWRP